jgi:hypothetical protein
MFRRFPFVLAVMATVLPTLFAHPRAAGAQTPSAIQAAWVELTGDGAQVRVATTGACPPVMVDGHATSMAPRTAASAQFPAVCSLTLPEKAVAASVEGRVLPVPRPARRIVILGDTGCRILGLQIQACNDTRAWPFAAVARLAAARKPDLVIHVGDYYYRETPCPLGLSACAGSPSGDRWETWAAEFFSPAEPLLAAAPWVFARGNHEICSRGGPGWYALLDAAAPPPPADGCPAIAQAFTVRTGDLNLFVIDSSQAKDRQAPKADVADIARQLDHLGSALDKGQGWIVTHRPIWGLVPVARLGPTPPIEVQLNFTERAAVRGRTLGGVQMVVSGHVHHFQAVDFGAVRPAQLIVGTGGDVGESADRPTVYGGPRILDGLDAETFSFSRFGYYLMEKDGDDWTGDFHDADDRVRATCRLHERMLTCKAD